jgi:hypothetical protein
VGWYFELVYGTTSSYTDPTALRQATCAKTSVCCHSRASMLPIHTGAIEYSDRLGRSSTEIPACQRYLSKACKLTNVLGSGFKANLVSLWSSCALFWHCLIVNMLPLVAYTGVFSAVTTSAGRQPDLHARCMTWIANSSFCAHRGTSVRRALVVNRTRQGEFRPLMVDRRQKNTGVCCLYKGFSAQMPKLAKTRYCQTHVLSLTLRVSMT